MSSYITDYNRPITSVSTFFYSFLNIKEFIYRANMTNNIPVNVNINSNFCFIFMDLHVAASLKIYKAVLIIEPICKFAVLYYLP